MFKMKINIFELKKYKEMVLNRKKSKENSAQT